MVDIKKEFFSLLRAGLWGTKPNSSLFNDKTDWDEIYKKSKQQALLGIILDGIELLPSEKYPPRPLYLKWCAEVLHIEDDNRKLDLEVVTLFNFLRENGVEPVLMKGQGIARSYPNPSHRSSGDIDIFIGKENYDKVNRLLSIEGKALEKWSSKHIMYKWHDEIVENHRLLATLISPVSDKNLDRIINDWHKNNDIVHIDFEGSKISVPPDDFNAIFLILHAVVHLMDTGIGLRQLCDWSIFIHKKHGRFDSLIIKKYLGKIGFTKAWKVFGALSVKYLGLPEEDLFWSYSKKDEKTADILLNDIWNGGNFGFESEKLRKRSKIYLFSRIEDYKHTFKRAAKFYYIAPYESLWLPFWRIRNFFLHKKWLFSHYK